MAIIEFEGLGGDLLKDLVAAKDAIASVRKETEKESEALKKLGADGGKATKDLAANMGLMADALTEVNRQAGTGSTLSKGFGDASKSAGQVSDAVEEATENLTRAVFASDQLSKSQRQIRSDALKVTDAVAKGNITQAKGLQILGQLSKEYKQNAVELAKIKDAARQVGENLIGADEPVKSLRTQMREAKAELDQLIEASDGKITPELIAAAKKAGELSDRIGDLQGTVEAFNPDTKFKALVGVLSNVASGVQAVTAGIGLFGEESEDVNRALLKIQQTTAFIQGLQGFVGGLADNWKNLKTVIAASALATQADTTAKVANTAGTTAMAGANTAAAGATGVLTTAFGALKAAILSNPLLAAAAAVAALAVAVVKATSDTKDYAAAVDELSAELDALTQKRIDEVGLKARLGNIQAEREALEAGETEAAKRRQTQIEYENNRAALVAERLEYEVNMLNFLNELESLRGKEGEKAIEARKKATDELTKYTGLFKKTGDEIQLLEEENTNAVIKGQNDQKKAAQQAYEERAKKAKETTEEIARIESDLAKRVAAAQLEAASPRQRLDIQREAELQEIEGLRNRLAALQANGQLTVAQEEQIANAQFLVWDQYWKEVVELDKQNQQTRLDLLDQGFEKDRAQFDAQLAERVAKLREAGAAQVDVEKFIQRERDTFRQGQVAAAIDQEERIAIARVEAQQQGAESELVFRQRIELEKLAIQQDFAQQRLKALEGDASEEAELQRLLLQKTVNDINAARAELQNSAPQVDLFKLLGIEINDEQKQQVLDSLQQIGDAFLGAYEQFKAAQLEQLQAQIDTTDQLIEDQQRRKDELQAQLDEALADEREGYANRSDDIRTQLEAVQAAEQKATDERARLLEEEKRLSKQQIAIDAAVQASAILTANANLFAKGALKGLPGIAAAIAAGAAMVALFFSTKARMKAAQSDVPTFRQGGILEGPSHEMGGVPVLNRKGQKVAEAEGGEYFVNRVSTRKYRDILDSINEDRIPDSHRRAIQEIMDMEGISMDPRIVREIVHSKEILIDRRAGSGSEELAKLRKEVRGLREDLIGFKEQERTRERVDGNKVIKPGKTTVKR